MVPWKMPNIIPFHSFSTLERVRICVILRIRVTVRIFKLKNCSSQTALLAVCAGTYTEALVIDKPVSVCGYPSADRVIVRSQENVVVCVSSPCTVFLMAKRFLSVSERDTMLSPKYTWSALFLALPDVYPPMQLTFLHLLCHVLSESFSLCDASSRLSRVPLPWRARSTRCQVANAQNVVLSHLTLRQLGGKFNGVLGVCPWAARAETFSASVRMAKERTTHMEIIRPLPRPEANRAAATVSPLPCVSPPYASRAAPNRAPAPPPVYDGMLTIEHCDISSAGLGCFAVRNARAIIRHNKVHDSPQVCRAGDAPACFGRRLLSCASLSAFF